MWILKSLKKVPMVTAARGYGVLPPDDAHAAPVTCMERELQKICTHRPRLGSITRHQKHSQTTWVPV